MIEDLIRRNRSYRRFREETPIQLETLRWLAGLARLSPSAANKQPLKFFLSADPATNERIFPTLSWAAYLTDWEGPGAGERPSAYIIILGDRRIKEEFGCDHGIAAQSMLLGAVERGLGGCMIASVARKRLREELGIPDHFEILLVIALGEPVERVVLEEATGGTGIEYWRDDEGVHHVPKRPMEQIVIEGRFDGRTA